MVETLEPETAKRIMLFDTSKNAKQEMFLDAVFSGLYNTILYGGAIRGGKTYAGLGAILLLSRFYPGSRWAAVRQSLPSLKQTLIPSFKKVCPSTFLKTYNQETQTITFKNGSQLIFWSENYEDDKDLDRWKGLEVNGFFLDECNELQEVSFWKAKERAGSYIIPGSAKMPMPLIMASCNPSQNWVKDMFFTPWELGTLEAAHNGKWLYIPAKMSDNVGYSETEAGRAYIESVNEMPEYQRQVFVEGNWNVVLKQGGEYFKCFDLDKHTRKPDNENPVVYNSLLPLHISWDENVNPYLPVGIFQVEIDPQMQNGKTVHHYTVKMIGEIAAKNPDNKVKAVCEEICRLYHGHQAGMLVYGDATASKEDTKVEKGFDFYNQILQYLGEFKPRSQVLKSNFPVFMRAGWMNTVFEKEVGNIKFLMSTECKVSMSDFVLTKEDENGGKLKKKETNPVTKVQYQAHGHFCDLLEYFMTVRFMNQFQTWMAGGAVSSITYGRNTHTKNSYK